MTSPRNRHSPDPYAVLGLPHDASQAQITHAYRRLVRRFHPDTRDSRENQAEQAAADSALQQTMAAYLVLGDPDRRARHDRLHAQPLVRSRQVRVVQPPYDPLFDPPFDTSHDTARPPQPPIQAGPVRWHTDGGQAGLPQQDPILDLFTRVLRWTLP